MIEHDHADDAERIVGHHAQRRVVAHQRQQIDQWLLEPIDLAGLQCGGGGGGVRHHLPLDPIEMHDLGAGGEAGCLGARLVFVEPRIDRTRSGDPFVADETIGAAADDFVDLLERVGLRDALGHDETIVVGDRHRYQWEWLGQVQLEAVVVECAHLRHPRGHDLAERVALAPAVDRGDAIGRAHRCAIVEHQPVAQGEPPGELIGGHLMPGTHLRPRLQVCVQAIQRIPDHVGVVARDVGRGPDRIRTGQVRLWHEAERARGGALRDGGSGKRDGRQGPKQSAASHVVGPLLCGARAKGQRISMCA